MMTFQSFVKGMVAGLVFASLFTPLLLMLASMQGWVVLSVPSFKIMALWHWVNVNLGFSVFFFVGLLMLWLGLFTRLNHHLTTHSSAEVVQHAVQKLDLTVNLFIAVGVIFTAIGLRDCLISTLGGIGGGLGEQSSTDISAFEMMGALINNGLLVALTSTIIGAIGGYLLKAAKSWCLGAKINAYNVHLQQSAQAEVEQKHQQVVDLLDAINQNLNTTTTTKTTRAEAPL